MSYFRTSRNVELSLLKYLEDSLNTDWSGVTTCKNFKQVYAKNVSLPIVCVHLSDTQSQRHEVGSTTLRNRYLLMIDIFSRSDAQRLDLADYIKSKLKDGWVHYDHSQTSGDPTTLTLSANGREIVTEFVADHRVDLGFGNVDEKDKYRHLLSVRVRTSA